jgi:lipopolysaccharide export system permease protein
MIMFFVGAPFGALVRKGGFGVPVIASFIFYLMYYVLTMIAEKSVKTASISAWFGMWYPIIIILLIGIYLTYLAVNDRSLPSVRPFVNQFMKRIIDKKHKKVTI